MNVVSQHRKHVFTPYLMWRITVDLLLELYFLLCSTEHWNHLTLILLPAIRTVVFDLDLCDQ